MSTRLHPSTNVSSSLTSSLDSLYGLTALPADASLTPPATSTPGPVSVSTVPVPTTPLARRIAAHARATLAPETYNHSLRVYTYGLAVARECFPQWHMLPGSRLEETWFLAAMLHDIGTTPEALGATKLSFEFWGGYRALEVLQRPETTAGGEDAGVAPREQAESVAEAIIRHQDVQDKGSITLITRLIHLGTLLDNIGAGKELVHPETIRNVNEAYSRAGWSGCFRDTVAKEKELKPWAMVSRIEGFEESIEANGKGLMRAWE